MPNAVKTKVTKTQTQTRSRAAAKAKAKAPKTKTVETIPVQIEVPVEVDPNEPDVELSGPGKTATKADKTPKILKRNIGFIINDAAPNGWKHQFSKQVRFEGKVHCDGCDGVGSAAATKLWILLPVGPLADNVPEWVLERIVQVPESIQDDGTIVPAVVFARVGTSCLHKFANAKGDPLTKPVRKTA
jgi:hypothetical protein